MEFFSRDRGCASSKNRLRKCDVLSRNFSAVGEQSKSSSEDWNLPGHLPGIKGKKGEVDEVPCTFYPSHNLSRCEESLGDFSENREKLDSFSEDLKKCSEGTQISRETEHVRDAFDAIGCLQDPVKVEETQDTKERKEAEYDDVRHLGRYKEWPRKCGEIEKKLESVSGKVRERLQNSGKDLENHFEMDRTFNKIKEKLISLSEDAQRCPGRWLEVAEEQDAVGKESLKSSFMTLKSERAGNFSDKGRSASGANDVTGLVEHQLLQAQQEEDAVACSSNSVEAHDRCGRLKFNHMSFFLVNEMQETEVKVIGFSSQAPNLGSRRFKERLGGISMNKEKKDASESEVRLVLQGQEGCRREYPHPHGEQVFFNTEQKPSISGICPQFCSEAGINRRTNEIGPKVYGRRDESLSYENRNQGMLKNKVKYGGRKALEADGKENGQVRRRPVKSGERPKRRYPRSKLLELRYMNIDQQKRRWSEIYQGLSPAVAKEYNQISACYNQKQSHRDADWPPQHRKNKDGGRFRSGAVCKLLLSDK